MYFLNFDSTGSIIAPILAITILFIFEVKTSLATQSLKKA
jgi:hypothetical protein